MAPVNCRKCLLGDITRVGFWRDVIVEFFATFMLVAVQCSLPLTWGSDYHGNAVQVGYRMSIISPDDLSNSAV